MFATDSISLTSFTVFYGISERGISSREPGFDHSFGDGSVAKWKTQATPIALRWSLYEA